MPHDVCVHAHIQTEAPSDDMAASTPMAMIIKGEVRVSPRSVTHVYAYSMNTEYGTHNPTNT
jgi:hypothetical protein